MIFTCGCESGCRGCFCDGDGGSGDGSVMVVVVVVVVLVVATYEDGDGGRKAEGGEEDQGEVVMEERESPQTLSRHGEAIF